MRALKVLVVVMGVMLVGGFIALIVSIAYMAKQRQAAAPAAAGLPGTGLAAAGFAGAVGFAAGLAGAGLVDCCPRWDWARAAGPVPMATMTERMPAAMPRWRDAVIMGRTIQADG